MSKSFNFLKIYVLIATVVWLIGMIVAYGIALYASIEYTVINDSEFLANQEHAREIQQCTNQNLKPQPWVGIDQRAMPDQAQADTAWANTTWADGARQNEPDTTNNQAESDQAWDQATQQCIKQAEAKILLQRRYDFKTALLQWSVWWTIFLIVFLLHYPKLRKED